MLSNVEREKLVIDLYYNQRKNVRQIAQEARMYLETFLLY
jgi:DNA-directed RNA polymerase specialized sigma subunit